MTYAVAVEQVPVKEGDVLADKYRVERVLGHGGMGIVVAARHIQLGFLVALKFMLPMGLAQSAQMGQRFLREARAAGMLKSEHVARIMDFGTLDDGAPYIVMEFLEGTDLDGVLKARGRLEAHEAAEYVLQACKAMAEAHGLGIIHRDLKPQNMFVTRRPDGTPLLKVLDFGISKVVETGEELTSMTASHAILGSPNYMSPEQARSSKSVDARADIYALGVVLYQLVTGRTPVNATTLGEMFEQIFAGTIEPPRMTRPDLPRAFDALIMRCLEKSPDARFQTVQELVVALSPFAALDRYASIAGSPPSMGDRDTVPAPEQITTHPVREASSTLGTSAVTQTGVQRSWATSVLPGAAGVLAAVILVGAAVVIGSRGVRHADPAAAAAPTTTSSSVEAGANVAPLPPPTSVTPEPPPTSTASLPSSSSAPSAAPIEPSAPKAKGGTARPSHPVAALPLPTSRAAATAAFPPSPRPKPTAGAFDNPE